MLSKILAIPNPIITIIPTNNIPNINVGKANPITWIKILSPAPELLKILKSSPVTLISLGKISVNNWIVALSCGSRVSSTFWFPSDEIKFPICKSIAKPKKRIFEIEVRLVFVSIVPTEVTPKNLISVAVILTEFNVIVSTKTV